MYTLEKWLSTICVFLFTNFSTRVLIYYFNLLILLIIKGKIYDNEEIMHE